MEFPSCGIMHVPSKLQIWDVFLLVNLSLSSGVMDVHQLVLFCGAPETSPEASLRRKLVWKVSLPFGNFCRKQTLG